MFLHIFEGEKPFFWGSEQHCKAGYEIMVKIAIVTTHIG